MRTTLTMLFGGAQLSGSHYQAVSELLFMNRTWKRTRMMEKHMCQCREVGILPETVLISIVLILN